MSAHSLRLRLVAGGIGAILLALILSGAGLVLLFERHVTRAIADDLRVLVNQLIGGVDLSADRRLTVVAPPSDPRFSEPLSGLYWQVSDDRSDTLRSRSLWDTVLPLPPDRPAPGTVHQHVLKGPAGRDVLVVERVVQLSGGGNPLPVRVAVAADLSRIANATTNFSWDLAAALALLGLVLAVGTVVQVGLGLRPLAALRRGLADIRVGRSRHLQPGAPREVQPLVEELNALIDAQEQEIERSRGRAADLAHGLKTPLAALVSDAARIRSRGEEAIARDIEAVADGMRRHIDRELARARLRGQRPSGSAATELAPLVDGLVRTLSRTPYGVRLVFEQRVAQHISAPFDRTDLAEVLGNLLENAARHARSRVCIRAEPARIAIEDDGPGIAPEAQARALARGERLDRAGDGAGLGLAIVQDVLDAYGWRLSLGRSAEFGGMSAVLAPLSGALEHAA